MEQSAVADGAASASLFAERLFAQFARDVHAYLGRRVGRELAFDLTAETFRVVVEQADRFDPARGHERAWLFGIATNILRNRRRSEQRRLAALARSAGRSSAAIDPLIRVDERLDAEDAVGEVLGRVALLDPADRDLVALYAWEGCTYAEVAEALGVPVGTVRSRLHRIRRLIDVIEGGSQ